MDELLRRITQLERWRDSFIQNEVGRWLDWTPTVTQVGSVTVTIDYARYMVSNNLVVAYAHLSVTGSGTGANAIFVGGLPFDILNNTGNSNAMGLWNLRDASVPNNYTGVCDANGDDTFFMRNNNSTGSGIGAVPNLALASGDTIGFTVTYERG